MIETVVSVGNAAKNNIQLQQAAEQLNVPFKRFKKNEFVAAFKMQLEETQPDLVLVFGLNFKIPAELFNLPRLGFYNVHFSLLPAYRGRNPVFWQLKNCEHLGGITIHKIAEEYDTGPILIQDESPVYPGDSLGIYSARLSLQAAGMLAKAIEKLEHADANALTEQDETKATYCPSSSLDHLRINWETQSAKEIESLVNAANPDYGGAITILRSQMIRILEVTNAQLNNPGAVAFSPGSIVLSDPNYGIFAACKNSEYLRLNIIHSSEGILSGFKLAGMGIQAGERFESGN